MSVPYRFLFCLLLIATSVQLVAQVDSPTTNTTESSIESLSQAHVPGVVLFKLKSEYRSFCQEERITHPEIEAYLKVLKVRQIQKNFRFPSLSQKQLPVNPFGLDLVYELRFEVDWELGAVVNYLEKHAAIEYAEPRYIYTSFYQPNDPLADSTGGIANQWYLAQVMAREAWDITKGDTAVVIGITDSGISFKHPDLRKNLGTNAGDPIDGLDNDQDGYIDNYRGWDFAGASSNNSFGDNDPSYVSRHGVNVTGISSATPDNGIGSAGAAFNCRYLPVKAAPDDRPGAITHGYESVLYAALQGAKVINCSWGGRVQSRIGQDVINYVIEVTQASVVAACGNAPANLRFYPAAFSNVLSVTNLHFGDTVCCPEGLGLGTTYNYSVDVGAPGWKLSGPTGDSNYEGFSGTSAASPLASAVVAITCAHFPNYTGFQAAQRVRVTTDDNYDIAFNQQFLHQLGTGRVNMYRALTDPLKPSIRNLDFQLVSQRGDAVLLPGDTAFVTGDFINYLDASTSEFRISLEVPKPAQNQYIEWIDAEKVQGVVQVNESFDLGNFRFAFRLSPQAPHDLPLDLRFVFEDSALRYADFQYIYWLANPTIVDLTVNNLHTSMNSTGNFGYQDYPRNEIGLGVQYRSNERSPLFEGGLLIGKGPDQVSANLRDASGIKQQDFVPIQPARLLADPRLADQEAEASFNDAGATNPLGISVVEHAYAWSDSDGEDFVIFDFTIHNDGPSPITDLYAGLMANWNISDSTKNSAYFNNNFKLAYVLDRLGNDPAIYGISLLSQGSLNAYAREVPISDFSDRGYYEGLSNANPNLQSAGLTGQGSDIWHMLSEGPFDILPNSSYRIGFAVLAAGSINNLFVSRNIAAETYRCYVLEQGPTAGFDFTPDTAGINQQIIFSDLNQNASSWRWDFGDGSTSNIKNPSHIYQQVGNYTVNLEVGDGSCWIKSKRNIRVDYRQTGVTADFEQNFQIYPNPSNKIFWLESKTTPSRQLHINLYDMAGHLLFQKHETQLGLGSAIPIDLSGVVDGIYLLEVVTEQGSMFTKLKKISE